MAKYLYVYHGGSMPETEAEAAEVMNAWGSWMDGLGSAIIDGGNPVGPSTTLHSDKTTTPEGGANPASGYSLIEASSMDQAVEKARGCPILSSGGTIEIAEALDM